MKLSKFVLIVTVALMCNILGETPPPSVSNSGRELSNWRWRHRHPTPRPAETVAPTATEAPTATVTPTATASATFTPTATATDTPTPTATPTATPSATSTPSAQMEEGLYYMPSSGRIDPAVLGLSYVDGVVTGVRWQDVEPTEGNYVWNTSPVQSWDTMLSLLEAAGKPTRTEFDVGIDWQPDWIASKVAADTFHGGKTFTFKDSNPAHNNGQPTIFVPWEPTALGCYRKALLAWGAYNASHPLVRVVQVPLTPFSIHNDFNPGDISNTVDGILPTGSTPQSRWLVTLQNSGFATYEDALIYTGKYLFDATRAAFPNAYLTTPIGRISNTVLSPHAGRGGYISSQVVTYAAGKGPVCVMKWNLHGAIPASPGGTGAWNDLYLLSQPPLSLPVALQEVWKAYNDNCLTTGDCIGDKNKGVCRMSGNQGSCNNDATTIIKASVDLAIGYGARAIEMFEEDIKNCPEGAKYAHDQLLAANKLTGVRKAAMKTQPPKKKRLHK